MAACQKVLADASLLSADLMLGGEFFHLWLSLKFRQSLLKKKKKFIKKKCKFPAM
jgi:hypothetical protein